MKWILLVLMMIPLFEDIYAQNDYYVLTVRGKIKNNTTDMYLDRGDSLNSNDQIEFIDQDASAALLSPQRGRLTLKSSGLTNGKVEKFVVDGFTPILARRGKFLTKLQLQNFFRGTKLLILEADTIRLGESLYQMDSTHFFIVQFEVNSQAVNNQLNFEGDRLILRKQDILRDYDGNPIAPSKVDTMKISYYDAELGELEPIAPFHPVFPDEENLKHEIEQIIKTLEALGQKKEDYSISIIRDYLSEFYGEIDEKSLKNWLRRNFGSVVFKN